jgi:hypothetical protein
MKAWRVVEYGERCGVVSGESSKEGEWEAKARQDEQVVVG